MKCISSYLKIIYLFSDGFNTLSLGVIDHFQVQKFFHAYKEFWKTALFQAS